MSNAISEQLANDTCGCRIKFHWLGTSMTLEDHQVAQAARVFDADTDQINIRKKLLNTKIPEYKAVNAIRTAFRKVWVASTLPFPDAGVRLIKRDRAPAFADEAEQTIAQLDLAVESLNLVYGELLDDARNKLGTLFDRNNYPETLEGQFRIVVDFPNLTAPDYLAELSPELYQREVARVQSQFDSAVQMAEAAFAEELQKATTAIVEKLSGQRDDGKPQIFHDTLVTNLTSFFDRYRDLGPGGNPEFDRLINEAQAATEGVAPATLRTDATARQEFRDNIARISTAVEEAIEQGSVARPVRRLKKRRSTTEEES